MVYIILLFGIISVAYYTGIGFYTGSFGGSSIIWLAGGIALILGVIMWKHGIRPSRLWTRIIGGAFAAGFLVFAVFECMIISQMNARPFQPVDYIVVLGAQVRGTRITRSLRYRLDAACEYLTENPGTAAVVSGGQGPGEDLPEAEAMKNYLVEKGIGPERILVEKDSVNTNENLKFSRAIIDKIENNQDYTLAVVSNNFHIYRAVSIGKKQGLASIEGLAARSDAFLLVNYMVREAMAVFKDFVVGNM